MGAGRREAEKLFPDVSRETWARLEALVALLLKWRKTVNLVAPKSLPEAWTRHVADSLQVLEAAKADAKIFVDLGSGGGFPGLVIAAQLAEREGAHVHLIESDQRKCAFLREAARVMRVPATVHNARIESALANWPHGADVVTARALAPLSELLYLAAPLLKAGTEGIFLKGQDVVNELTQATKSWTIEHELRPSRTDPSGSLVIVRGLSPR